jgi:hypothetical protein
VSQSSPILKLAHDNDKREDLHSDSVTDVQPLSAASVVGKYDMDVGEDSQANEERHARTSLLFRRAALC